MADRLYRVRVTRVAVIQSAVAAALAWFLASLIPGHPAPYFAPIAAVIALGVSFGQRTRRAFEIGVGVAVGVLVGDVLVVWIGVGTWQIFLAVAVAMFGAVFVGGSVLLVNQAASSAVLIVALTPVHHSAIQYNRFIDAVIGGSVALVVNALVLPLNPITLVQRASTPLFDMIMQQLESLADALQSGSEVAAHDVLVALRDNEAKLTSFADAVTAGRETAALAPARWHTRGQLAQLVDAATHVDRFVRNLRVCARRAEHLLAQGTDSYTLLADSLRELAKGVDALQTDLLKGENPVHSGIHAIKAVTIVSPMLADEPTLDVSVIVAQVRSMAIDLLGAAGVDTDTALEAIREAAGESDDD